MSLRTITTLSINTILLVAVASSTGTVMAGPLDLAGPETGEMGSVLTFVSQKVAWWSPEDDSDELKLLFSEDREVEELKVQGMAEILKEDPLGERGLGQSLELELLEPIRGEKETDSDSSAEKESAENESAKKEPMTDEDRLRARLSALRKPASRLTLVPAAADDEQGGTKEPVNRAATLLFNEPPEFINGSFHEIVRADRMPGPFCHRPTYFQELNLERCGQLDCERCGYLQNAYSSFWFLTNAALLPYRIGSQSPCKCVSAYGDCRTCQRYDTPIEPLCDAKFDSKDVRGTLLQAASMAGFAFLLW